MLLHTAATPPSHSPTQPTLRPPPPSNAATQPSRRCTLSRLPFPPPHTHVQSAQCPTLWAHPHTPHSTSLPHRRNAAATPPSRSSHAGYTPPSLHFHIAPSGPTPCLHAALTPLHPPSCLRHRPHTVSMPQQRRPHAPTCHCTLLPVPLHFPRRPHIAARRCIEPSLASPRCTGTLPQPCPDAFPTPQP